MLKKITLGILAFILIWIAFIWTKYHFSYPDYSQEDINNIFKKENLKAPVYDSINLRGYSIRYLTNRGNENVAPNPETGRKKPYLFLVHDSGKNSGYFLDYFKNKDINTIFHVIAVDRIGFGGTHLPKRESNGNEIFPMEKEEFGEKADYVTSIIPSEILKQERQHIEEVRIVTNGCSGLLGAKAFNWMSLSVVKAFMFYPETEPRFIGSMAFSKLISSPVLSFLFPRAFVNKHKDLLLIDDMRGKDRKSLIDNAKYSEDKNFEREENLYYKRNEGKRLKSLFFMMSDESKKKQTEKMIGTGQFSVQTIDKVDIYTQPQFVFDKILANEIYTMDINQIKK
ncbi:uncharacterized protein CHSO_3748 [Chryseobacterium sp. StRB126]|uniref:hypothetical protein n=1 Tax=Chryseobacterium sp. StRB126 TaxID=878220 RepID=UPI0004E992F0|nr:hypothetical protein [Chryseobacterium sp. StRB126]BAP32785.1 uncharacterized protein CHSO_3748 [Chryseobacterium sp. StRB126]